MLFQLPNCISKTKGTLILSTQAQHNTEAYLPWDIFKHRTHNINNRAMKSCVRFTRINDKTYRYWHTASDHWINWKQSTQMHSQHQTSTPESRFLVKKERRKDRVTEVTYRWINTINSRSGVGGARSAGRTPQLAQSPIEWQGHTVRDEWDSASVNDWAE